MAIINSITGYYGFTLDGTEGSSPVDRKGQVDRCIIAIIYPPYKNDVTVTISDGPDDWGIKMGDDSIIPLRNPKILFTNRDNCIAQFDMDTLYPSNSPCSLVYRSDTAKISMKEESSSSGEFKVNSVSGHFAFTTNSFGASTNENGEVNKLMATIPFPYQISTVRVTISNGVNEWGARMGDGSIIPLRNPEVIRTNSENAIVKFDMDNFYPSNSPCILVYLSENASIGIEEIDDNEFHPVTNIIDVPTKAIAGEVVDLNTAKVLPWNASIQKIDWTIVSGTGMIRDKHYLVTSKQGTITIRGTIENGMEGDDATNDFVKTFNVTVSSNVITIDANPAADMKMYVGKISGEISVVARSNSDHIKYQWYKCNNRNYGSSVKLEGSTQSTFKIPTSLGKGEYFYYCELTSDGAATVKSQCCRVYVDYEITSIRIVPRTDVLPYTGTRDLNIEHSPAEADPPRIVWRSSDSDKINVDVDGNVTANLLPGTITITAETVDGKHRDTLDLTINDFVSVTDIVSVMTSGDTDTNHVLTGNVIPATASYRTIIWSVADAGGTGASISNGVLRAVNPGIVKVKATIEKGLTFNTAFTKEFFITITKKFVPVTDVIIECDTTKEYLITDKLAIVCRLVPNNSTNTSMKYSIVSGPGLLTNDVLSFNGKGDVVIRATVENGISNGSDYSKTFVIKCSGKEADKELIESYIPVTKVTIEFPHTLDDGSIIRNEYFDPFEEGNNPMTLPCIITPEFATNKDVVASITNIISRVKPIGVINGIETVIPDSFWSGDEWEKEDMGVITYNSITKEISCDISKIKVSRLYQITIHVVISNGRTKTEEFADDIIIKLSSENRLPWIPLANLEINCPSKMRVYYPILATDFNFIPVNSDIKFDPDRNNKMLLIPDIPETEDDVGALIFDPKTYDLYHTIPPLPIFDWNRNYSYMYPYNPGILKLQVIFAVATVNDVNNYDKYHPDKVNFTKDFTFEILPPFIPVDDIFNIPETVYSGSNVVLSPEVSTGDGLSCYNPCWDEEAATNNDVIWSIKSKLNGVNISEDGIITIDSSVTAGTFTIESRINEGLTEYLEWYGKTQDAEDFVKTFNIKENRYT